MVWTKWHFSLLVLVACAGLSSAQPPACPSCSECSDHDIFVMINEEGKAPQKCKVIGCWHEGGKKLCQVQAVETGELMTIVDPPVVPGAPEFVSDQSQKIATQIFHWGDCKTCPPGFPRPPANIACACGSGSPQIVSGEPPIVYQSEPSGSAQDMPVVVQHHKTRPSLWQKLFGGSSQPAATVVTPPRTAAPPFQPSMQIAKADSGTGYPKMLAELAPDAPLGLPGQTPTKVGADGKTIASFPGYPGTNSTAPLAPANPAPQPNTGSFTSPAGQTVPGNSQVPTKSVAPAVPGNPVGSGALPPPLPASGNQNAVKTLPPVPPALPVPYSTKDNLPPVSPKTGIADASGKKSLLPPTQPPLPNSQPIQTVKNDPLANANALIPNAVKKKLDLQPGDLGTGPATPSKGISAPAYPTAPASPGAASPGGSVAAPAYPPSLTQQSGGAWTYPPGQNPGIPLGAQSANAAYNGANLPVKYLPTQVVTVPQTNNPPYPPPPNVPSAPNPTDYVNAFTPPKQAKEAQNAAANPIMAGTPYAMGNPYYGNPYMSGYPMMAGYPGYGMGQQMMYPPQTMMAQGNPYANQVAWNPMGPRNYQGPMPPNPVQNPQVSQASYQQGPAAGYAFPQTSFANPAMDRPAMATNSAPTANVAAEDAVYQLLRTLKTAFSPAQREWAAMGLGKYDWHNQPYLVQGLLIGAKEDPAPTVRVACVKTLVRLGVNREVCAGTFQGLREDMDPRVRQAAEEALGGTSVANTPSLPTVTPAGHSEKH